ncbi:MAG: STAS domain-containing protein [Anaerolineae bacterium]|nr:STAS domain-containing protein [Anaerolineae bacterium]
MGSLTITIILLPQAIAFALIAELPPQAGLYTAIVGGLVAALWGASSHIKTGPSNAISLLVLSALAATLTPGTPEFVVAAGMLAVMAGIFQLTMGLARLGMLVNFVSHSVIVGFASGAAILIAINQVRRLLGLQFSSQTLIETLYGVSSTILHTHWPTAALGVSTIGLIFLIRKLNPKLPAIFLSMTLISIVVYILALDRQGVEVIGQLPTSLPPLAQLPIFDINFIARLSTGALAVGAIGLVQTTAISRAISAQTGQRTDSNQEFIGQGLANIAAGLFSGYACSGSFAISAVHLKSGARSQISTIFSSVLVVIVMFTIAPLAAFLPRTALAGVLIVTAYGMIDQAEIRRIWRSTRGDAIIMLTTFLGTLFLSLEFAVLAGILLSFAHYIMKTSVPRVYAVLPDENFSHFVQQRADQAPCPQLGIIKISGDLYFGAVSHVEEMILEHLGQHPDQRFLLFRMHGVNQCDFSGIHMLETIRHTCQERGGDIFFMKVQPPSMALMKTTGFYDQLGADHFLKEEEAIGYLFHKLIDPAICIYECPVRAFLECQNLPKQLHTLNEDLTTEIPPDSVAEITPLNLWKKLHSEGKPCQVIDVREPREFMRGHIPEAELIPFPKLLTNGANLPPDETVELIFVCRGGRRSTRAAHILQNRGRRNVRVLQGGMLAWEAAGLLEAIDT